MGRYFADARTKPLYGWIVAGEVIGGVGLFCVAVFAVLAFGWVRQPKSYGEVTAVIANGFPWYLVLWSSLGTFLTGVGVIWVIAAHLVRAMAMRRDAAKINSPR